MGKLGTSSLRRRAETDTAENTEDEHFCRSLTNKRLAALAGVSLATKGLSRIIFHLGPQQPGLRRSMSLREHAGLIPASLILWLPFPAQNCPLLSRLLQEEKTVSSLSLDEAFAGFCRQR